jgi:hypothetical protein
MKPTDPNCDPQPEALAAPLEPRCPKCGSDIGWESKGALLRIWCSKTKDHDVYVRSLAELAQFFTAQPPPAMIEPINFGDEAEQVHAKGSPMRSKGVMPTATHDSLPMPGLQEPSVPAAGGSDKTSSEPAEPHTLTREPHSIQADTMMGVYCGGNALEIPLPINWDGWQRVANYANRNIAESLSLSPDTRPSGDGWIKCSERLPEVGQTILAMICNEYPAVVEVSNPVAYPWPINPVENGHFITHWQPWPSPPTEEKGPSR